MKKFLLTAALCFVLTCAFSFCADSDFESVQPTHSVPVVCIEMANGCSPNNLKKADAYLQAYISICDENGEQILYDEFAAAKIRGNSTSYARKKPFNLKLSESVELFGMGSSRKWVLLANTYDKTLMRNKLVFDFAGDIGLSYSPESCYADVYFNGDYLGCYLLTQAVEIGQSRVNIHPSEDEFILEIQPYENYSCPVFLYTPLYGICLGLDGIDCISAEQADRLAEFFLQAETALSGGSREEIEKYFDISSFVDTYIIHEYFKNIDVATSSTRFYIKDGLIHAGPVWDFDLSCGNYSALHYHVYNDGDYTIDMPERWYARCLWWAPLFQTEWFNREFEARYLELQPMITNLYQDNQLGTNRIDSIYAGAKECFQANYREAGWEIYNTYGALERAPEVTYEGNIAFLREWLEQRNLWILEQILPAGSAYE